MRYKQQVRHEKEKQDVYKMKSPFPFRSLHSSESEMSTRHNTLWAGEAPRLIGQKESFAMDGREGH